VDTNFHNYNFFQKINRSFTVFSWICYTVTNCSELFEYHVLRFRGAPSMHYTRVMIHSSGLSPSESLLVGIPLRAGRQSRFTGPPLHPSSVGFWAIIPPRRSLSIKWSISKLSKSDIIFEIWPLSVIQKDILWFSAFMHKTCTMKKNILLVVDPS